MGEVIVAGGADVDGRKVKIADVDASSCMTLLG